MKDKKSSSCHVSGKKSGAKASARGDVVVPEVVDGGTYSELVNAIGELLHRARSKIAAVANFELVKTYWETGRYIVECEQHGADRAKYGEGLIVNLSMECSRVAPPNAIIAVRTTGAFKGRLRRELARAIEEENRRANPPRLSSRKAKKRKAAK